jgi:hypothetical protein
LKRGQKLCPNLLIKKKRGAQLINEKPSKNRYKKKPPTNNISHMQLLDQRDKPTTTLNLQLAGETPPSFLDLNFPFPLFSFGIHVLVSE